MNHQYIYQIVFHLGEKKIEAILNGSVNLYCKHIIEQLLSLFSHRTRYGWKVYFIFCFFLLFDS